jgi:hypothetical protein
MPEQTLPTAPVRTDPSLVPEFVGTILGRLANAGSLQITITKGEFYGANPENRAESNL